jgi:hypothetical protein
MEKQILSRITIDIPEKDHKKFKALAAMEGTTMRELVIEFIESHLKKAEQKEIKNN